MRRRKHRILVKSLRHTFPHWRSINPQRRIVGRSTATRGGSVWFLWTGRISDSSKSAKGWRGGITSMRKIRRLRNVPTTSKPNSWPRFSASGFGTARTLPRRGTGGTVNQSSSIFKLLWNQQLLLEQQRATMKSDPSRLTIFSASFRPKPTLEKQASYFRNRFVTGH